MNIGVITYPNQKGQVVIPKRMRDALGFAPGVAINIVPRDNGVYLFPVNTLSDKTADETTAFLKILDKTRGSWANDDWPETEKRRRKIELDATRRRKKAW